MSIRENDASSEETDRSAENRYAGRAKTDLKTIVQCKADPADPWKEVTNVTTVSRNGAGFTLSHPCQVGQLLTLVLPLPVELRAYDENEDLYPVMGLVQYCNPSTVDGKMLYHVGVGFIGKNQPDSFKANPGQNYRITGVAQNGLWTIVESQRAHKPRKSSRFWIPVDLVITVIKKNRDDVGSRQRVVTKNISAGGALFACDLDLEVGDRIKVGNKELDFYTFAEVKDRKRSKSGETALSIAFLDNEFPMDKVLFSVQPETPPA